IADAGMLGAQAHSQGGDGIGPLHAAPGSSGGGPDVDLVPEDIRVSATVDARFVAAS
ncbi:SIMPL domain-containing protein, partial [Mycobacterium sp. ITM-2017-0098]